MAETTTVAVLLVAVLGLITPVPPFLLDFFVVANLLLGILSLILSVSIRDILQLSSFPAILLTNTIFRVCLSIAITRSILGEAEAGEIVKIFGETLLGGNVILGIVVYCLITIIQFFVISKGGERVAEVSARFTLDSLPGRQMSIDADVRMGLIDPEEAKRKRVELQNESRFYGALDGTMKFVKGDAIAGILIVIVNLIGGIAIGILMHDMGFEEAVATFSTLSIGEGLVNQIPSFLNGLSAGFLVSRVERESSSSLSSLIFNQLVTPIKPKVILGCLCLTVPFISPMPLGLFSTLGVGLLLWSLIQQTINRRLTEINFHNFNPSLGNLLTVKIPKNANFTPDFSELVRQAIFDTFGIPILRSAFVNGGDDLEVFVRDKHVATIKITSQEDTIKEIVTSLKPHISKLVEERSIQYLYSLYETGRGTFNNEQTISLFKVKEIVQTLLKDGVYLSPLDVALETLFNLPGNIDIDDGAQEVRKRILPYKLSGEQNLIVYMLDQKESVELEEMLTSCSVLPFNVVKILKEILPDEENVVLICFRQTAIYLRKVLGMKNVKILSTEEVPDSMNFEVVNKVKLGVEDHDFTSTASY